MSDVLHCIGDSHASFFSGQEERQPAWPKKANDIIPSFRTYKVGPSLAYSLCESKTKTRGREKLFKILKQIPDQSNVMLCFGEIDCRAHVMKRVEQTKKSPASVVQTIVKRYFSVVMEIVKINKFRVFVWNVIPSSYLNKLRQNRWPVYGTVQERNKITKIFNDLLKERCDTNDIPFIDVFDHFVDGLMTKKEFYHDDVHFSQRTMPIVLEELKKYLDI